MVFSTSILLGSSVLIQCNAAVPFDDPPFPGLPRRPPCFTETMNIQQLLQGMADRVSTGASVKNVYGDPVIVGNRTVIPAAQVRYAFGGGGGNKGEQEGGGGGGGCVSARPCGALEVTVEGTRFIAFDDRAEMGAALALGFVLGAAVVALAGTRRIEVVKRAE
jgi:uncharacterized spore protein YtfJ